MLRRQLESGRG